MSKVDYNFAEKTSKLVLQNLKNNKIVPNYIFHNLLVSVISLMLDHNELGPNVKELYAYLYGRYTYDDTDKLDGFDIGAIYGAMQFYREFLEIKQNFIASH